MRSRALGWTLSELLIALALAAMLSLLSVQAYQQQILKSRRALAVQALSELASRQDALHLRTRRYAANLPALLGPSYDALYLDTQGRQSIQPDERTVFRLSVAPDASGYRLEAEALNQQAADAACQRWSLDARGLRAAQGSARDPLRDCWP